MSEKQSFNQGDARNIAGGKGAPTTASASGKTDTKGDKIDTATLNKFAGGKNTTPIGESHGVGKVTAKPAGAEKVDAKLLGKFSGGKGDNTSPGNTGGSKTSGNATGTTPQKIDSKDLGKVAGGFVANEQKVKAEIKPLNAKVDPLTGSNKSIK